MDFRFKAGKLALLVSMPHVAAAVQPLLAQMMHAAAGWVRG